MLSIPPPLSTHWRALLCGLIGLTAFAYSAGCEPSPDGIEPPHDELYNPLSLAAHPGGRYLFVTNAVFNRQYNASTVSVIDTFERRILSDRVVEVGLFAGEITLTSRCDSGEASCDDPERVLGLVPSRDTGALTALEVTLDAQGVPEIQCGQTSGSSRCGGRFVQPSLPGEDAKSGPFSLSTDARGAYLTHVNRGFVSRWDFTDEVSSTGPLIKARCQVRLRGAYFVTQHPITGDPLVSDLSGASLYEGELSYRDPSNTSAPCDLTLTPSVPLNVGGVSSEAHSVRFSADGSQLYSVDNAQQSLKIYQVISTDGGALSYQLLRALPLGPRSSVVRVAGRASHVQRGEETTEEATEEATEETLESLGGGLVYVTSLDDDTVTVINPHTLTVLTTIQVGSGPHDITFMLNEEGKLRGYVSLFKEHAISVLDLHPGSPSRFTEIEVIR